MKTRAELKRELNTTIPEGEELTYLSQVETSLSTARSNLNQLRSQRAKLMRQISVRQRKLHDWKGKIPRSEEVPTVADAKRELQRLNRMPAYRIGTVSSDGNSIHVYKTYKRALRGVDGFSHIWIIYIYDNSTLDLVSTCMSNSGKHQLRLQLCQVRTINEHTGEITLEDTSLPSSVTVVDIKPYLRYCESWSDVIGDDNTKPFRYSSPSE